MGGPFRLPCAQHRALAKAGEFHRPRCEFRDACRANAARLRQSSSRRRSVARLPVDERMPATYAAHRACRRASIAANLTGRLGRGPGRSFHLQLGLLRHAMSPTDGASTTVPVGRHNAVSMRLERSSKWRRWADGTASRARRRPHLVRQLWQPAAGDPAAWRARQRRQLGLSGAGAGRGRATRVVVDRQPGHGRSTRDARPYSYELMASRCAGRDGSARHRQAAFVGWSDGACTALCWPTTHRRGSRASSSSAATWTRAAPAVRLHRAHRALLLAASQRDYAALSATPDDFEAFSDAVGLMQRTQPNYSACRPQPHRGAGDDRPGEHDEFIKREHAEYLAATHARRRTIVSARREPFRAAAAAGGIQPRDAGVSLAKCC